MGETRRKLVLVRLRTGTNDPSQHTTQQNDTISYVLHTFLRGSNFFRFALICMGNPLGVEFLVCAACKEALEALSDLLGRPYTDWVLSGNERLTFNRFVLSIGC